MKKHFKTETYTIIVDKGVKPTPEPQTSSQQAPVAEPTPQEKPADPSVESVSNIFGSVELLE